MRTHASKASTRRPRHNAVRGTEVVLGGGANRGLAHPGLLRAIEELKIIVGMVTGVSIGSLIATFYTNGYTPKQILEIFMEELSHLPAPGLVRSLLVPSWVGRLLGGTTGGGLVDLPKFFASLIDKYELKPQPNLRIVAYHLLKRRPVVFEGTDYDLLTALCASCAVPFLMRPVWFGQRNPFAMLASVIESLVNGGDEGMLVDGGVHHPYPGEFSDGPAIIGKLGFAQALPDRLPSLTDLIMHLSEMLVAPLLNWYFKDPEGHVVIDIGLPNVACMSFGLSRDQCLEMEKHAYLTALPQLKAAIKAGLVQTRK